MITKYEDFLNEGLYDWLNKKTTDGQDVIISIIAVVTVFTIGITGWNNTLLFKPTGIFIDELNLPYLYFLAFLNLPLSIYTFRKFTRDLYDSFRSGTMKYFTNKKIEKVERIINEFPEIEQKLTPVKRELRIAIINKDKKKISKCIHQIYVIAKELKDKNKYKAIFNMSDREKEFEQGLINKEEEIKKYHKKIDPLGEEDWSDTK